MISLTEAQGPQRKTKANYFLLKQKTKSIFTTESTEDTEKDKNDYIFLKQKQIKDFLCALCLL
jgi:hypothetical protein